MNTGQSDPLIPELKEAELALESTLEEACDTEPASKADTGELIRVDELLEAARDAAKRAISLRRRQRADKTQRNARTTMGDVEVAASPAATHRVFADAQGVQWDVFAVYPEPPRASRSQLKGTYSKGWLCFDSATEKRRLSPIPDRWQQLTDEQLAQLSERAESATRRRGRSRGPGPEQPRQPE
jgi:hypothetical protein